MLEGVVAALRSDGGPYGKEQRPAGVLNQEDRSCVQLLQP